MNKSKKRNKSDVKKIKNRSKNTTIKNKSGLGKCDNFCKNDYITEMDKINKLNMNKYFKIPYKPPSKATMDINYNSCKKKFCNTNCEGIIIDKQKELEYKKMINNGFHKSYSNDKVEKFKNRGAISGCIYVTDYDVYHK